MSLILFLSVAVLLTGCQAVPVLWATGGPAATTVQRRLASAMVAPEEAQSPALRAAMPEQQPFDLATASTNRLLVQGVDGNLFTVAPDGTERFNLTDDAGNGRTYTQPTWSSTGERIAWTAIQRTSVDFESALITARANGMEQTSAATPYPPFYLYWSPDDSKVAYLSNWVGNNGSSIALRAVDVASGGKAVTTIDIGQPYYFSWAPDSSRMVAHVGNRQVRLLDLTDPTAERGDVTILVDGSANFAAPQWYSSTIVDLSENVDDQLLYVIDDDNTAQLVISNPSGDEQQFLTYLARQDFVSFSMNARGNTIAYIETSNMIGLNSFGPLFVYNLEDEIFEQLSTDPAIAFFWSPDGTALFFLTIEATPQRPWLRVNVWDGTTVQQYERFVPSPSFLRDYLRFADQYMQSMRFWSPDSSAIVYTGQGEDGIAGVWVQPIMGEQKAQLAAVGTFATWSPR